MPPDADAPPCWRTRLLWLMGITLLLRGVVAWGMHFGVDEAYAVAVARPLSLGYLDHPPAVFWLSALGEWLSGGREPWWLRLPFLLAFTGTTWLMARVGDHLFGAPAGFWTAVVVNVAGMLGVTAGSWILPDGPLLLGSALCGWGIARGCFPRHSGERVARWWVLAGVGAAMAALSMYHAIFLPVGVAGYLLTTPALRPQLRTRGPWLAALVALPGALPTLWWNATHGWASFRFQGARALPTGGWSPAPVLEMVGGQLGYLLPWVALPLWWAVWRAARTPGDLRARLLLWLGAGPVVLFTVIALLGRRGLPHWTAMGYLLLAPLLGAQLAEAWRMRRRWPVRWGWGSGVATAVLALVLVSAVRTGWATRGRTPDPTAEALGWDAVADSLLAMRLPDGQPPAFAATVHWMHAGKLGAALGDALPLVVVAEDRRHFHYRAGAPRREGAVGVLVRLAPRDGRALEPWMTAPYARVTRLSDLAVTRGAARVAPVERYLVVTRGGVPPRHPGGGVP
jgi:hypothetical protein